MPFPAKRREKKRDGRYTYENKEKKGFAIFP
jgi:hypothetical protein